MTQGQYATKSQYDRLARKVDLLDQELILLKAQIQATLFAIQDCILSSTYPSLGGDSNSQRQAETQRQWHIKRYGLDQIKAVPAVYTLDEDFGAEQVPPFDPPLLLDEGLKRAPPISLPDEKAPAQQAANPFRAPAPPPIPASESPHAETSSPVIPHDWLALDRWVSDKVREVGIVGALELAKLCCGQERDMLLKIVMIYQSRCTDASTPAPAPTIAPPSQPAPPKPETQPTNHNGAPDVNYAAYRPFGEHQEMVLRLLEQVLRSREVMNPPTNGNHAKG